MSSVNQSLSLFIPHVFPNITQERIADVFYRLGLGEVKRVDRILKRDANDNEYYSAYVHFNEWFNTKTVLHFQERVYRPDKEARVVYDDPWYWIVLENTGKKNVPGARKPTIDIGQLNKAKPTRESIKDLEFSFEENFDLVDAAYAEYYEVQLSQERAKVTHLEEELWNVQQELLRERSNVSFLSAEVGVLQQELMTKFKTTDDSDIESQCQCQCQYQEEIPGQ